MLNVLPSGSQKLSLLRVAFAVLTYSMTPAFFFSGTSDRPRREFRGTKTQKSFKESDSLCHRCNLCLYTQLQPPVFGPKE